MTTLPGAPCDAAPPPIELMGALCSLLIHDFANHVSVISGNAQCAQMFPDDPQRTAQGLAAILKASEVAANLLVKCGDVRRQLGSGLAPGDLSQLGPDIAGAGTPCPGWTLQEWNPLEGRISIPVHWVRFAIREYVRATTANTGTIRVAKKPPGQGPESPAGLAAALSSRGFLEVKLAWNSDTPFPLDEIRSKHLNLNLLAAHELVKVTGGKTSCATPAPGNQEITLCVPLAATE